MHERRQPTLKDLWEKALSVMRPHVSQATYHSWLRNARPLRIHDGVLSLAVPNQFVKEWLEQRYKGVIESALTEASGEPMQVLFQIESPQLGLPLQFSGDGNSADNATQWDEQEGEGMNKPMEQVSKQLSEAEVQVANAAAPNDDSEQMNAVPTPTVTVHESQEGEARGIEHIVDEFTPIPLNPKYTFERFVVGRSNSLSHAAAWSVAHHPAEKYNPLFIYGGVGLGKTHLMQAIGHKVREVHPELRVVYVSGETFLYHVVTAIREDKTAAFRRAYRSVDVWLVDDIQFIASADRTEVEFFHIFNELYDTNRQIVICSDRPPRELNLVEGRLRSRFEWGLITEIAPPDLEHRIAILQRKAEEENVTLPEDVALFIAQAIQTNIRVLEGALTRVIAHASFTGKPINLETAKASLRDYCEIQPRMVELRHVQKVVAEHFNVDLAELRSSKRNRSLVQARHIAMYLAREMTSESLPDIGRAFGRDHTSVLYAHEKISDEIKSDSTLSRLVNELKARIELEAQAETTIQKV